MDSLIARFKNTVEQQKKRSTSEKRTKPKKTTEKIEDDRNLESRGFAESKSKEAVYKNVYAKTQTQRIIDILLPKAEDAPTSIIYLVTTFNKVYDVIEQIMDYEHNSTQGQYENEINRLRELKESTRHRSDQTNRAISDLETRLIESEKDKLIIKKERDELKLKISELKDQLNQIKLSHEVVNMLQESHRSLQRSNECLRDSLEAERISYEHQQKLWELELIQLKTALSQLQCTDIIE